MLSEHSFFSLSLEHCEKKLDATKLHFTTLQRNVHKFLAMASFPSRPLLLQSSRIIDTFTRLIPRSRVCN